MPDYTPIQDLLAILNGFQMQLVGSTAINGEGEDIDIAVCINALTEEQRAGAATLIRQLQQAGCEVHGGAHYQTINFEADDHFTSLRRGNYNILMCMNLRSWQRFTIGRDFCILLRELGVDMSSKAVRVACHGAVQHGNMDRVRADLIRLGVR